MVIFIKKHKKYSKKIHGSYKTKKCNVLCFKSRSIIGYNHDLCFANNCNNNTSSYTQLGGSYAGSDDQYQLNGAYNFQVKDYEVFQVLDVDKGKTIQSKILNETETNQLMKWLPN
eukprot:123914_1